LLPIFAIAYSANLLDFEAVFGRNAPSILEIGFGMGETTAQIAALHPGTNFLAIDVHTPGVGSLLKQINEQHLKNVRIIQHDAVEIVRDMIPAAGLHGIHVFLLQADFVSELATRLEPRGYLHVATDWQEYAEHILQVLSAEPLLANTAESYSVRPAYRPRTKFEERGLKLGHDVWDLVFRRR